MQAATALAEVSAEITEIIEGMIARGEEFADEYLGSEPKAVVDALFEEDPVLGLPLDSLASIDQQCGFDLAALQATCGRAVEPRPPGPTGRDRSRDAVGIHDDPDTGERFTAHYHSARGGLTDDPAC